MLSIRIFCSLSGLAVALVVGASSAADAQTTALRGARVIDGRGAAPLDNATIVIRDGRIVSSVRPPELRFPATPRSSTIPARPLFQGSSRTTHT